MSHSDNKTIRIAVAGSGATTVLRLIEKNLRATYPDAVVQVSADMPDESGLLFVNEASLSRHETTIPLEPLGIRQVLDLVVKAREAVAIDHIETGLWAAELCELLPPEVKADVSRIKQAIRENSNPFIGFDDERTENLHHYLTTCSKDFLQREIQALMKTIEFLKPYSEE